MAENSAIEWTDNTFNPWIGCSKVHSGCTHCYAEDQFDRRRHHARWGVNGTRVLTTPEYWRKPLRWNAEAAKAGQRIKVFCGSLCDVFEDWNGPLLNSRGNRAAIERISGKDCLYYLHLDATLPSETRWATMQDIRRMLFELIDDTPHLDWQLLTKRPENIARFWMHNAPCSLCNGWDANCSGDGHLLGYRANVWLGTSISDQASADAQIPELLKCRDLSPVLFLSCEPLLGPIELTLIGSSDPTCYPFYDCLRGKEAPGPIVMHGYIDWVIAGGESGPNARECHPAWIRGLRDNCHAVGLPFFFKQWGEWAATELDPRTMPLPTELESFRDQIETSVTFEKVGKTAAGNTLDGLQHLAFPEVRS